MQAKMRTTMQCGRKGSAVHNEHRHIDAGDRDVIVRDFSGARKGTPLRDAELEYYTRTFGAALEEKNQRYKDQRHPERCKTMEQVYTSSRMRPEEVILQVGDKDQTVDRETFEALIQDFFKAVNRWNRDHGKPFQTLNTAIHYDEATPHLHWRRVWQYEDDHGKMQIGQSKALEKAGVPLPTPSSPSFFSRFEIPEVKETRYNNRKMTFDKMIRETWQEVCRLHGLEIETQPLPARRHKDTEDYIDQQIAKKADHLEALKSLEAELEARRRSAEAKAQEAMQNAKKAQEALEAAREAYKRNYAAAREAQRAQQKAAEQLKAITDKRDELIAKDKQSSRAARKLMDEFGYTGKDYHPER